MLDVSNSFELLYSQLTTTTRYQNCRDEKRCGGWGDGERGKQGDGEETKGEGENNKLGVKS